MGTNEMLKRSVTYEEALLRNYKEYAKKSDSTEIGDLFTQLVSEKEQQLARLKGMLKRYCKP